MPKRLFALIISLVCFSHGFSSDTIFEPVSKFCQTQKCLYQESIQLNYILVTSQDRQIKLFLTMPYISCEGQVYFMQQGLRRDKNGQWEMDQAYRDMLLKLLKIDSNKPVKNEVKSSTNVQEQWIHQQQTSSKDPQVTKDNTTTSKKTNNTVQTLKVKQVTKKDDPAVNTHPVEGFVPLNAIIIDAGHGGKDPGAIGKNGIKEKEVVYNISKYLSDFLKADKEYSVFATRNKDIFVTLEDRTQFAGSKAKKYNPLFISIHGNMSLSSKAEGIEVFSLGEKASDDQALQVEMMENEGFHASDIKKTDALFQIIAAMIKDGLQTESSILAKTIFNELAGYCGAKKRGLKKANFYVLKYNSVPSILVEVGFLSHPAEGKKLGSVDYQKKIAKGLYLGLKKYIREYNKTKGFSQ